MPANLYIATYSNVDVYECFIDDVPLMRRCTDDWINATQILKAAKFPKAHRTRILEREVQTGIHEKIQGGYGRFQGTWIPLHIARPLAHKYKITDEMAPILSYVADPSDPVERKSKNNRPVPISSGQGIVTATSATEDGSPSKKPKRVYNTKKRREAAAAAAAAAAATAGSTSGTTTPMGLAKSAKLEKTGSQPLTIQQAQKEPLNQDRLPNGMLPPVGVTPDVKFWQQNEPPRYRYEQTAPPHMAHFVNSHQQQQMMQAYQQHPHLLQQPQQQPQPLHQQHQQLQHQPQNQQQQPSYPPQHQYQRPGQQALAQPYGMPQQMPPYQHKSKSSNENWSQDDGSTTQMDEIMRDSDTSISSDDEHSDSKRGRAFYTDSLIQFFANDSRKIPQNLLHPPADFDFNEPIDEEGHTPLHWAASMASIPLIELLLKHGADPLAPNSSGLNSVSRAVFFNNSFQKENFHLITSLMKNCLYTPDKSGRTPFHYLCESTRSKPETAQYYLSKILDQLQQGNKDLLQIVVNHQDVNGDTAMSLARRNGNGKLASMLERYQSSNGPHYDKATAAAADDDVDDDDDDEEEAEANDCTDPFEEDDEQVQHKGEQRRLPKMPLAEVGPMLTSMLSSLADAYDTELKNKEEESHHTQTVLNKLKQDLESTESQNREVLAQIDTGLSLEQLLDTIATLEKSFTTKSQNLGRIIERSQALSLAQGVLKEESAITGEPHHEQEDAIVLGVQLTRMQVERTRTIGSIMEALTKQSINSKMNNYRRLISLACEIKIENVDELIDEIEADLLTTVA